MPSPAKFFTIALPQATQVLPSLNGSPFWLLTALLFLLLVVSAWLVAVETGMLSLNRYRLKHLAKQQRSARRVYRLLKKPDRLRTTFLVGHRLAGNLAAMVAALVTIRLYGEGAVVVAALVLTLAMVIFIEALPRTLAALHPEKTAFSAGPLVKLLLKLLHPVVWLAQLVSDIFAKIPAKAPDKAPAKVPGGAGGHHASSNRTHPVAAAQEEEDDEAAGHHGMLINILDLEKVTVNDIMVPRNEIAGLNLDDSIETLVGRIVSTEYARLPLYQGDINNVIGFLQMRKVNRLLHSGGDSLSKESLQRLAREPYFIPESTPLQAQLAQFQKSGQRIALVVDEYGEILGLVTLEDILEEIVGKFTTNYAASKQDIIANPDGSYTLDAAMNIRDINKAVRWQLPTDGPKTLNGLLLETLEHIPEGNVCLQFSGYCFETLSLSDKMIDSVQARWLLSPTSEATVDD